jgi:type I restriction enzyme S subunit
VLSELLSAGGDDWTETTLGDVAEASWGNTTVTKKQYRDSGFTAFSASGPDGFVDWFEHDGKGVVLSAIGALCGKTWLADGRWTPIKNTIWFKSITDNCLTEYLFLLSQTPHLWPIRGQAQPFIALGDVRVVELMLPPIAEQTRIVGVISSLDKVIRSADNAVADAKNLRSGLLSDLLSGAHEIPESYDRLLGAA